MAEEAAGGTVVEEKDPATPVAQDDIDRFMKELDLERKLKERDLQIRKDEMEMETLEIALQKARMDLVCSVRTEATAAAKADQSCIYTFYDSVSSDSVKKAMEDISLWARRCPGCPITVIFNSPGGSVIDGLALYDFLLELRANGHYVETVALGMAASMGGILLQAGDKRIIGRNAVLLIHEASMGTGGKVSELEDELSFIKMLQDKLVEILAERSTMSQAAIKRKWHKRDWWLTATQAVDLGFADGVR